MNVDNLERFEGSGVHYAGTAVEAALCQGEQAAVVGGGNSAVQAPIFLSRSAAHVHLIVRRDSLHDTMSDYLIQRIAAAPERITVHTGIEVDELSGGRHLEAATWIDRSSRTRHTEPITNLFLMLGAMPNTEWLDSAVSTDAQGFVLTGVATDQPDNAAGAVDPSPNPFATSCTGIFVVGDVRANSPSASQSPSGRAQRSYQLCIELWCEGYPTPGGRDCRCRPSRASGLAKRQRRVCFGRRLAVSPSDRLTSLNTGMTRLLTQLGRFPSRRGESSVEPWRQRFPAAQR